MKKLLIIGLDCGNPYLIEKWRDELPNLKKLIDNGFSSILESTIPSTTVPAWCCLFSGKNPGKLGLYDFIVIPYYAKNSFQPANYLYAGTQYLWDILTASGRTSQIINVPNTYPPTKLRGLMISGGLLAPMYRNITYPTELNEEIQRVASGYESLPFTDLYIKGKEEENMEKLFQNIEKQTRVVKHLMSHHEWDFLAYVFYQPDAAAHYYWHHYDKNSSWDDFRADPKWENAMKEIYKKVDDGLGQILESAPSDSNVIIVSDHGSGPLKGLFNVNEWLSQQKLLSYRKSSDNESGDLWLEKLKKRMVGGFPGLSKSLVRVLPKAILQRFLYSGQTKSSYAKLISRIKWNETTAYALGSMGSIYVNLRGREPIGTVSKEEYETVREKIISGLKSLRNPLNGEPVRISIWKREEIYSGPMLEQAPDILFMMEDYQFYQRVDVDGGSIWRSPDMSGGHSRDGLFIAYGPDIRKGGDLNMRFGICDVMPTALHMSGVDIPSDVDGRVLMEIFRNDSPYFQNKPKLADQKAANVSVEPVYTSEEEEEINQRLKDLGYV